MRTGTAVLAVGGVVAPAVEQAAEAVVDAVAGLERAASASGALGEWLAVVGACQGIVNRVAAVQDVPIAAVARVEQVWREDGTVGEVVHGPGRAALDAADLVAPLLGASRRRAQSRVEDAVRLTGRDSVPLEVTGAPARSGLGADTAEGAAGTAGEQPDTSPEPTSEASTAEPGTAPDPAKVAEPVAGEGPLATDPTPPAEQTGDVAGRAVSEPVTDPSARGRRVPGSGGDLVAVSGSRPGEPILVPAACWPSTAGSGRDGESYPAVVH